MSQHEFDPTQTLETIENPYEFAAQAEVSNMAEVEQSRLSTFMSGVGERIHDIKEITKSRRHQAIAVAASSIALAGAMTINVNTSIAEDDGINVTNDNTKSPVQKMYESCAKKGSVSSVALSAGGGSRVERREGIRGTAKRVNGKAVYTWKLLDGYKMCGKVVANYENKKSRMVLPTKKTSRGGEYREKVVYGQNAISQFDIPVYKPSAR